MLFFEVGKNQVSAVKEVHHFSIAYRALSTPLKAAIQIHHVQTHHLFKKRMKKKYVYQAIVI